MAKTADKNDKEKTAGLKQPPEKKPGFLTAILQEMLANQAIKRAIIGFIVTISLIGLATGILYLYARVNSSKMMRSELTALSLEKTLKFDPSLMKASALIRERMQEQFNRIRSNEKQSLVLMRYYFHNYFICTGMVGILGIFSAIFLLFISKKGWLNSNSYLLMAFLTTSSGSIFFGGIPKLYEYDKNFGIYKTQYLQYVNLKNIYLSYAATGKTIYQFQKKPIKSPVDFIYFIDWNMTTLFDIPIYFNPEAATTNSAIVKSFTEQLQQ